MSIDDIAVDMDRVADEMFRLSQTELLTIDADVDNVDADTKAFLEAHG